MNAIDVEQGKVPDPPPVPVTAHILDMTGWIEWFNPHNGRRYITSMIEFYNAIQPIWYEVLNDNLA